MCDIKCLEHSTLIVPYELLNKKFRLAQKSVERESNRVCCTVGELEQLLERPQVRADEVNGVVDGLLDRLRCLKRKACEVVDDEQAATTLLKKRLLHLKEAAQPDPSPAKTEEWRRLRIDRIVIDYLLRTGYFETADQLAKFNDADFLSNLDIFLKAHEVEETLARGDTSKWSDWATDNKSKLRRIKSGLELKIRRQEFVELIKKGEKLEAVKFARKYFSELDAELWPSLTQTLGLLALPTFDGKPVTNIGSYNDMFSEDRWKLLVDEFRVENLRLFCLSQPIFSALLQCGLSAMKTPKCAKTCRETANNNATIVAANNNNGGAAVQEGAAQQQTQHRDRRAGSASVVTNLSAGSRSTSPRGRRQSLPPSQVPALDRANFPSNRDAQCPLCTGPALRLAAQLPLAHASQSRLVCAISGEPVNDANPPLALPNGMVYGTRALQQMAVADPRGRITCPRTGQRYELAQAERVFVM